MNLLSLFKINQGHQITDLELYSAEGSIPVLTGDNELKGYWSESIVEKENLPCLTYPTKGFSGNIFIQEDIFDANNTAVLIPRKKWRDEVVLEWFAYKLPTLFFNSMTNKEGVSYLNKNLVQEIEINLPDKKDQENQVKYYRELKNWQKYFSTALEKIHGIREKTIFFDDLLDSNEGLELSSIIDYVSRNDYLSEEGIYKSVPVEGEATIKVLSGDTSQSFYGEVSMETPNIHYIKKRQILRLVTRGKAGKLTFFPKGDYATNTNAFILFIREEKFDYLGIKSELDEEYYLKALRLYLEARFVKLTSFADVSVFPLTDVMNDFSLPYFKINSEIKKIVDKYDNLQRTEVIYTQALNRVNALLQKEIK